MSWPGGRGEGRVIHYAHVTKAGTTRPTGEHREAKKQTHGREDGALRLDYTMTTIEVGEGKGGEKASL